MTTKKNTFIVENTDFFNCKFEIAVTPKDLEEAVREIFEALPGGFTVKEYTPWLNPDSDEATFLNIWNNADIHEDAAEYESLRAYMLNTIVKHHGTVKVTI